MSKQGSDLRARATAGCAVLRSPRAEPPGHEFWREKAEAEKEGLTQKQFNERMNNPDLYQIEAPSPNRSHRFEKPKDKS